MQAMLSNIIVWMSALMNVYFVEHQSFVFSQYLSYSVVLYISQPILLTAAEMN